MRAPPPCAEDCATLDAPERAVRVPANAEVDQEGRFADRGDGATWAGFAEKCVRLYKGVSEGESRKRWWDMASTRRPSAIASPAHSRTSRAHYISGRLQLPTVDDAAPPPAHRPPSPIRSRSLLPLVVHSELETRRNRAQCTLQFSPSADAPPRSASHTTCPPLPAWHRALQPMHGPRCNSPSDTQLLPPSTFWRSVA